MLLVLEVRDKEEPAVEAEEVYSQNQVKIFFQEAEDLADDATDINGSDNQS